MNARFTLIVMADGKHSVIVTPDDLTPSQAQQIRDAFNRWQADQEPQTLIIGSCDLLVIDEIELDISAPGPVN